MRKLVTVRKIDSVKKVGGYEVLVIDGVEVAEYHSPRDLFHAGEYCVYVEAGVALPAKEGRPWTATARSEHVEIYPTSAFPEIIEEMLTLAHDLPADPRHRLRPAPRRERGRLSHPASRVSIDARSAPRREIASRHCALRRLTSAVRHCRLPRSY